MVRREYVDPSNNWLMVDQFRKPMRRPRPRFVPHYGYNSLFPILVKVFTPVRYSKPTLFRTDVFVFLFQMF